PNLTTKLLVLLPLVVLRSIDGLAAAAFWPTMFAAMADSAPRERRNSAISTLTVAYMVGIAVGPYLAGWANDYSPLAHPRDAPVAVVLLRHQPFAGRDRGS